MGVNGGAAANDFFMAGTSPTEYDQTQSAYVQQHVANVSPVDQRALHQSRSC
ncbi:MAG: hypothetical protein H7X91_11390 [Burkholderiales bacterium]|nr:hypothetical protein [Burkholderiales bacterium]